MIRGHLLQLPEAIPQVDWRAVAHSIRVLPSGQVNKLAVLMLPPPEMSGTLHLPDGVSGDARSDVGIVVGSSGATEWEMGVAFDPPAIGTLVCVWPEDGIWIEGAETADGSLEGQLRVYGVFDSGGPEVCNWWDSVVCSYEEGTLKPFGDKIVVRLDPIVETDGGVAIPDICQVRTGMATVLSVGPLEFDVKVGDRVCYNSELLLEHGLRVDNADLAICDSRALLYTTTVDTQTVRVGA